MMFKDYFTPCWLCGRLDCNGDHRGAEAEAFSRRVTHHEKGYGDPSCPCHICNEQRVREANRSRPCGERGGESDEFDPRKYLEEK